MYDFTLLESVEGLGDPPLVSDSLEIWQRLQDEKTAVSQSLLDAGALVHDQVINSPDADASDEVTRDLEWRNRAELESRLRSLNEAQDRLFVGLYGRCADCGEAIDSKRLAVNPAAALCLTCQKIIDSSQRFCSS